MEQELRSLASFVMRHRRAVLAVWVAIIVAGAYFALHQADRLTGGGWNVASSDSARADQLRREFKGFSSPSLAVVVQASSPGAVGARLAAARRVIARYPELHAGPVRTLPSGRAGILPISYSSSYDHAVDLTGKLRDELVQTSPTSATRLIGEPAVWSAYRGVSKHEAERGELFGFPIIFLILLASFATFVAVLAPLALGLVAVFVTAALIYFLSRVYNMSIFVTNMASMIGVGVSVDYSLFIVSRFRSEIRSGKSTEEALRSALSGAGSAVVFSGGTVAVSLAGLLLVNLSALRSMAVGAIMVVIVAVLGSITLLASLLAFAGPKIDRFGVPVPWRSESEAGGRFWHRWTSVMLRRPLVALLAGAAVMLVLAAPTVAMKTFQRGLTLLPKDNDVRQATEAVSRVIGPGALGPVNVVVRGDERAARAIRSAVADVRGVQRVGPVLASGNGVFLADATLADDPEGGAARATYHRLERAVRPVAASRSAEVHLGGMTARETAVRDEIFGSFWKLIVFIVAVSYLVLTFLLRSVLLPLKAVFMNALSVSAAYGVIVAVFQWGWLDWTGYNSPGYVDVLVPPLLLAVTFGLSMDYEVFLLTRIRERQLALGDGNAAVAEGVMLSARIITSAALIMIAVFVAFGVAGSIQLKELGIGLAVAIGVDATIVRLVIVPATMRLLGDWNWWVPAWLGRVLPSTSEITGAQPAER